MGGEAGQAFVNVAVVQTITGEMVIEMETASAQFIPLLGLVIYIVLCVAAYFLFWGLRVIFVVAQRVLRLRFAHRGYRSMNGADCSG